MRFSECYIKEFELETGLQWTKRTKNGKACLVSTNSKQGNPTKTVVLPGLLSSSSTTPPYVVNSHGKPHKPCQVVDQLHPHRHHLLEGDPTPSDFLDVKLIQLCGQHISILDATFLNPFKHLECLDLTGNELLCTSFHPSCVLPLSLKFLNLSANKITEVPNFSYLTQLIHLNLSYNLIPDLPETLMSVFPLHLQSLDLTFNEIQSRNSLLYVPKLTNLKILSLMGNPVSLSPLYKSSLWSNGPHLLLDGNLSPLPATLPVTSQDMGNNCFFFFFFFFLNQKGNTFNPLLLFSLHKLISLFGIDCFKIDSPGSS
ncbi:hypothetical protein HMI56_000565 [Coelomomyces lativittatus]|nr:hypothetical protein HMI56_000565 [Coelomomyces lativittatus]